MIEERNLRATALRDPSLAVALRQTAIWIAELERTISDVTVIENEDGDWWVTIYWEPADKSDGD